MLFELFGKIGRWGISVALEIREIWLLVCGVAKNLKELRYDSAAVQMVRFGIRAIPIVTLVNMFVGMIVAVSMAELLRNLGVISWTGKVVGVAVTRELAPLMTGLVMSGFAGAAIATEIGTMTVNEEIMAMEVSALPPIRFLILPRMVGVIIMMMCLTVLANFVAMAGGYIVGTVLLGIGSHNYIEMNNSSIRFWDLPKGLIKAASFGAIITLVACRQGLKVTGGALGVGMATTNAVVISIVLIIAANLGFAILFNMIL